MNETAAFERAAAYLTAHLSHTGSIGPDPVVRPFVTLSREAGTGGDAFATALRARLDQTSTAGPWEVHSGNLIEEMLRTNQLPPHLARFLPEDRIPEIDASVGELLGLHPSLWDLVAAVNALMRHLAHAGHAILLGRGANFATATLPHGVHVRLIAPAAARAATTAHRLDLDVEAAATRNALCDSARRRYVKATFNAAVDDPGAYDAVLNLGRMSLDTAVDLVAALVHRAETRAPHPSLIPASLAGPAG